VATKTAPYDVGDDMIAYADFENAAGVLTTPTAGTLKAQDPAGTETTFDFALLSNPSAGRLEKTIRATLPGRWYFNWKMLVAGVQIVKEYSEQVRDSQFT
jgi:hypothetical protein